MSARNRVACPRVARHGVGTSGFTVERVAEQRVPGDVLVHLRRARDHMDRNFTSGVELDEAAGIANLSEFHFHRLFTATYGTTPRHTCPSVASSVHVGSRRIDSSDTASGEKPR